MLLLLCIMLDSDPDRRGRTSLSQDNAFSGSAEQFEIRVASVTPHHLQLSSQEVEVESTDG